MPATTASPPKRMTRARAKAVEEKQNIQPIATPAARAAKNAATKATKRKAPTDDDGEDELASSAQTLKAKSGKVDGKAEMNSKPIKAPVKRAARKQPDAGKQDTSTVKPKEPEKPAASKARGRPRKNTTTQEHVPAAPNSEIPTTRATRARAEANARTAKAAPPPRKRVTFQSDDKENEEVITLTKSKGGKPLSKPAAGTTRGIKKPATRHVSAKPDKGVSENVQSRPTPLSPSKGVQSNMSPQHGSPMKQSPARIPLGTPSRKSPLKDQIIKDRDAFGESIDELQVVDQQNGSPSRAMTTSITGSPARRPPQSPFKDAMKTSPIRLALKSGHKEPSDSTMTSEEPTMSKSPQKFILATGPTQPVFKMPQQQTIGSSLSQTSARRPPSPLKGSERNSHASTPFSNMKSSMLQSPARRPPSPIKSLGLVTPGRLDKSATPLTMVGEPPLRQSPANFLPVIDKGLTSPVKSHRASEINTEAYQATSEEQDTILVNELKTAPSPFFPAPEAGFADKIANAGRSELCDFDQNNPELIEENPLQDLPDSQLMLDTPADVQTVETEGQDSVTPMGAAAESFQFKSPTLQWGSDDDSEDELQTKDPRYEASPERRKSRAFLQVETLSTPAANATSADNNIDSAKVTMTALAHRFGAWSGASPDQQILKRRKQERSLFSPVKKTAFHGSPPKLEQPQVLEDQPVSSFTEAMDIREDEDADKIMLDTPDNVEELFRQSQVSDASQEYGDENATPVNTDSLQVNAIQRGAVTPARMRPQPRQHVIHTTSKVPLKPSAEDGASPLAVPKVRRSQSLSGSKNSSEDATVDEMLSRRNIALGDRAENVCAPSSDEQLERETDIASPATPKIDESGWSTTGTPALTPRSNVNPKLLSGAVVHVDVHTTEGADASGIFVDLLTQMGAKCVKQWGWNPTSDGEFESTGDCRVGITHVVFKDGGKRTMEKVRQAKRLVQCVGVGWVLDCERENKWLDESDYAVDISTIPRGGHRRRKSMEPRLLSNSNGTLSSRTSPAKLTGSASPPSRNISPSQQYLNLVSPSKRDETSDTNVEAGDHRVSIALDAGSESWSPAADVSDPVTNTNEPSTPANPDASPRLAPNAAFDTPKPREIRVATDGSGGPAAFDYSPTTPYFLHGPSHLVQQTCPPKQTGELLFPISGRIEEQDDAKLRQRLILARRKSMQFAPKIKSPLAKGFGDVL